MTCTVTCVIMIMTRCTVTWWYAYRRSEFVLEGEQVFILDFILTRCVASWANDGGEHFQGLPGQQRLLFCMFCARAARGRVRYLISLPGRPDVGTTGDSVSLHILFV